MQHQGSPTDQPRLPRVQRFEGKTMEKPWSLITYRKWPLGSLCFSSSTWVGSWKSWMCQSLGSDEHFRNSFVTSTAFRSLPTGQANMLEWSLGWTISPFAVPCSTSTCVDVMNRTCPSHLTGNTQNKNDETGLEYQIVIELGHGPVCTILLWVQVPLWAIIWYVLGQLSHSRLRAYSNQK